jgi:hypothetical protein
MLDAENLRSQSYALTDEAWLKIQHKASAPVFLMN